MTYWPSSFDLEFRVVFILGFEEIFWDNERIEIDRKMKVQIEEKFIGDPKQSLDLETQNEYDLRCLLHSKVSGLILLASNSWGHRV